MIALVAAAGLGMVTGAATAAVAVGGLRLRNQMDQLQRDSEAESLRGEVQGGAVHGTENAREAR